MPVFYQNAQNWTGREDPEDGEAAKRVFHHITDNADVAILGFACDAGVARNKGRIGAADAPQVIRKAMAGLSAPQGFPLLTDLGDVVVEGDDLEGGQAELAEHISKALKDYKRVIVLGGGHETAFGSYSGLRLTYPDAKIGILNLDAHLDLRAIGSAGPSSGTPFNQIYQENPDEFDYLCLGVAKEANTQALFDRAEKYGVRIVYDKNLASDPLAADKYIYELAARNDIIYLTIDIDCLPHYQAPGVSAPAARGISLVCVEHILGTVKQACAKQNCKMPLADIVEVSPPYDRDGMTAKTAAYLALEIIA